MYARATDRYEIEQMLRSIGKDFVVKTGPITNRAGLVIDGVILLFEDNTLVDIFPMSQPMTAGEFSAEIDRITKK